MNHMETIHMFNKEEYVSPEAEVIMIQAESAFFYNEGGEEGGEHDW